MRDYFCDVFRPSHILLSLIVLVFAGCFEIVEEIDHNDDGSGEFSYLVNMSQSREKLATLLSLDSIGGLRVPSRDKIEEQIEKGLTLVEAESGISNARVTKDYENFIFNISFHYDSITALNIAAEHIHAQMSPYGKPYHPIFDVHDNGFSRVADAHSTAFLQNLNRRNQAVIKDGSYTTVYRFNSTISSPDPDARISKSKKAIMYKYNTLALARNPHILHQHIILK